MIHYTRKEEYLNTWSHAAGILIGAIIGVIFLVWCFRSDNSWARLSVILYLVGMMGSYITSTIYHALPEKSRWKERMRRLKERCPALYAFVPSLAFLTEGWKALKWACYKRVMLR